MADAKKLKSLRTFFTISVAAFDFASTMQSMFSTKPFPENPMIVLHRAALTEIMKPEPDLLCIDNLLMQMIQLAEQNSKTIENGS